MIKPILQGYGVGLAASALALSPLVWIQLFSPGQPSIPLIFPDIYKINLANLIIPVRTWWRYGSSIKMTGNKYEQDGFLGGIFLVGMIILSLYPKKKWRPADQALLAWIIWFFILALGAFLSIDVHMNTKIPGPSVILLFLPALHSIIDARFMWGVFWGLGLLIAIRLHHVKTFTRRVLVMSWALAVVVSWRPAPYPVQDEHANPWITTSVQNGKIGPTDTILEFPYDLVLNSNNNVLYTQI